MSSHEVSVRSSTPAARSAASHARSSGAARQAVGNTLPLVPTIVGTPSPDAHVRRSSTENASRIGRNCSAALPYRRRNRSADSVLVRLSPLRPATRSFRPGRRPASMSSTDAPAAAACSAAISPAGPAPMIVTSTVDPDNGPLPAERSVASGFPTGFTPWPTEFAPGFTPWPSGRVRRWRRASRAGDPRPPPTGRGRSPASTSARR